MLVQDEVSNALNAGRTGQTRRAHEGVRCLCDHDARGQLACGDADVVVAIPATPSRQFGGSLFEQASLVLLDALIFDLTRGDPCVYEVMSQRYTNLE
jgi:hypothetical protein